MDVPSQRGTTLIEAMVAVSVLLVVALGTLGLHGQQLKMNGDARRTTEASALAQDLIENISLWAWEDARLTNANTANDADYADRAARFESANPPADHAEAELVDPLLGTWNGIPARLGFERYWNVAEVDDADGNGIADAKRIAVIVRWRSGSGWRRIVLLTSKLNTSEAR